MENQGTFEYQIKFQIRYQYGEGFETEVKDFRKAEKWFETESQGMKERLQEVIRERTSGDYWMCNDFSDKIVKVGGILENGSTGHIFIHTNARLNPCEKNYIAEWMANEVNDREPWCVNIGALFVEAGLTDVNAVLNCNSRILEHGNMEGTWKYGTPFQLTNPVKDMAKAEKNMDRTGLLTTLQDDLDIDMRKNEWPRKDPFAYDILEIQHQMDTPNSGRLVIESLKPLTKGQLHYITEHTKNEYGLSSNYTTGYHLDWDTSYKKNRIEFNAAEILEHKEGVRMRENNEFRFHFISGPKELTLTDEDLNVITQSMNNPLLL